MSTETWQPINKNDVETSLTAIELKLYSKEVTDLSPSDRLCGIINDVVAMVRSYIGGCDKNTLSEDSTLIPASCKFHAISIIRYRLLTALPGITIEESRTNEYNDAMKFLDKVASCTIGISTPAGTTTDVVSNILTPTITSNRKSRFNRYSENGW